MKEFWNNRYGQEEFIYGTKPNDFVKEKLPQFKTGKILFPAEGEGRNSVYAAQLGWDVSAFDFSIEGKQKADKFAQSNGVNIDYRISSFLDESYAQDEFDVLCLTFVHFDLKVKTPMHKRLNGYLKTGGHIILEAFSKEQREINRKDPKAGGPPDADMMYSIEEIKRDFKNYEIIELKKEMVNLNEGLGHVGESSAIRFIGRKIGNHSS